MAPFNRLHTSSYWRSMVTMALSCIISETNRDIGRKSRFSIPYLHSTPQLGGLCQNIAIRFNREKPVLLVLVLVLKESLKTKLQSLFWSLSLMVKSLSLSWSLLPKSLSWSWSLMKSPWFCPCVQCYFKGSYMYICIQQLLDIGPGKGKHFASAALVNCEYYFRDYLLSIVCIYMYRVP